MQQRREYRGIEYFKIIAAMLVIAIHTSPLESVSVGADFVLTRIIGRVAVPFFFMVTGFFVLPNLENSGKLLKFLKKNGLLYGAVILLYFPVSIYAGTYEFPIPFGKLWRDILFNGTFYHLWYLPASMLGVCILYFLLKRFRTQTVFIITALLYMIGLFGDSYYGLIAENSFINGFYQIIFQISEYTRNGIFMAPIFLMLGYVIRKDMRITATRCRIGLTLSFALFLTEGYFLYSGQIQRHDSMYIFLVPVMYFLFQLLSRSKGESSPYIKELSMYAYFLHPIAILVVRLIAKITKLEGIMLQNSIFYYISVVIVTLGFCIFCILIMREAAKLKGQKKTIYHNHPLKNAAIPAADENFNKSRAWIELNLDNLSHNVKTLQKVVPPESEIMAIVKANAYGHGDVIVSKHLNEIGIQTFGVAALSEGIKLRKNGIKGDILILGYTQPSEIESMIKYRLMQTVVDAAYAKELNSYGKKVMVHVKVDTGMHRLGEKCENIDNIARIFECENLIIKGTFSHLSTADYKNSIEEFYAEHQIESFDETIEKLRERGYNTGKVHLQNSYGILNYPKLKYDYVRPGIALYGLHSSSGDKTAVQAELKPVLSIRARITVIKELVPGEAVGYGCAFTAERNMRLGVVSIGYADGIPRNMTAHNSSHVIVNGNYAPIAGRICMDQLAIDITDAGDIKPGDIVTLIGEDGGKIISAEQFAENSETITNEIMSRLGERLERVAS